MLPERGEVRLQVVRTGNRVAVYARTADEPWTRHATGVLGPVAPRAWAPEAWPPPGAVEVPVDEHYARLAEAGYGYGPAFRGVQAMWRRDDEMFADVELPHDDDSFWVHPALFDACLHAWLGRTGEATLPFSWTGVRRYRTGTTAVRVRLAPSGDGVSVQVADRTGRPVLSVESLVGRPVPTDRLRGSGSLYQVDLVPLATAIQAKGQLHYHFAPRKDVPDERLFTSVYGDIRVEGLDDNGTRTSTTTTITLKKK